MHKPIKTDGFPVLGTHKAQSVPWGIFDEHIQQVLINHGQTLERLAERGGLDYREMYCILHDSNPSPLDKSYPTLENATKYVQGVVREYEKKYRRPTQNINGWQIKDVLQTVLSPDKVKDYSIEGLSEYLLENNIVKNEDDVKLLIIEGLQRAAVDDDEFPIHYYAKDEPMPPEGKRVPAPAALTDEYVEKMKKGQ